MLRGSACYAEKGIYQESNGVTIGLLICMFTVEVNTLVVPILDNVLLKWKQL